MRLTKKDIGRVFYLYPTGNNVKGWEVTQRIIKVELIGMKRVRGTFKTLDLDYNYEIDFSKTEYGNTNLKSHVSVGLNAGYYVFPSMENLQLWEQAKESRQFLSKINFHSEVVSEELLIKIAGMVKESQGSYNDNN